MKPRFGSASFGIDETCICEDWKSAIAKSEEYFALSTDVIVEQYINGTYYGVPIMNSLDGQPLIAVPHYQTSTKKGNIITNAQKRFTDGGMKRFISFDDSLNKLLKFYAGKYYAEMQPCDYARLDFIVEANTGIPYFLEVNVLMNLGQKGGFIASFLESGFASYENIIEHILNLGFSKIQ